MHCPKNDGQLARCEAILETTERLIESQGIVSFKLSQVMKDAGCANASFYKLFESKEDLLVCVFLRNATCNHFQGFIDAYPKLSGLEKVLVPIMFTFETLHFAPAFNVVRQVAVNRMLWSLASSDKIKTFEQRINQYWSWIKGFIDEAVASGELDASEEEVLDLVQAITFYLSGSLAAYQSQLVDKGFLAERRETTLNQLQRLFSLYRWQTPLTLSTFERIGMRVHNYYKEHKAVNNSCRGCLAQQQA